MNIREFRSFYSSHSYLMTDIMNVDNKKEDFRCTIIPYPLRKEGSLRARSKSEVFFLLRKIHDQGNVFLSRWHTTSTKSQFQH
jgi:hypothetical protein